ncbi:MAG: beta-N-acetylhexosaminidase [Candidatus Cryptobacteroides sp.]
MKPIKTLILTFLLTLPAIVLAKDGSTRLEVIPHPNSVEMGKGHFKAAGAIFNCESGIDSRSIAAIREFAERMTYVSGYTSTVAVPGGSLRNAVEGGRIKGFVFLVEKEMESEEYSIEVTGRNCIVRASGFNGFLYATQTLMQLVDASVFGDKVDPSQKFLIPCMKISDKPRFAYRGLHLDCSRHFFPVEEVIKVLDIMAVYKLNRFHWHLTDDQGWRIEIKKYPRLTSVGAFRAGTMIGGDKTSNDGIRHGGYYTQDQIREVVSHAASLGIEVIPEIDLPGHMSAAIAAYPQLSCHDDPMEVPIYWGVFERTLCPGKDATFTFLEDVFTEIMDLFPYEYYHIGGDECPKTEWEKCPDCQARIKELGLKSDSHASAETYLQNYVTARIQAFLGEHGHKIIGWDEILEGELQEGATVMSWRGTAGGELAASRGFDVIMTPVEYCYFDQSQAAEGEPLSYGLLDIGKVYSYNPLEGMDEKQQKHILGVQANLWGENIATPEHLEYMLLPRLCAMSEVQWCQPEIKDWDRFNAALRGNSFRILTNLGYNFRNKDN